MCSKISLETRFKLGATRRRIKPTEFDHQAMKSCFGLFMHHFFFYPRELA